MSIEAKRVDCHLRIGAEPKMTPDEIHIAALFASQAVYRASGGARRVGRISKRDAARAQAAFDLTVEVLTLYNT